MGAHVQCEQGGGYMFTAVSKSTKLLVSTLFRGIPEVITQSINDAGKQGTWVLSLLFLVPVG